MINKTTILAITLAFTTAACSTEKKGGTDITANTQNKTMTAEEVAAKGFERIEIKGSFDVHFTIGNKTSIRLKGKSEEIARTKLESDGQTLRISVKNGKRKRFLNMGCDVDIYITSPLLTAVKIKGAGDFDSQNEIKAETFSANISGSGDMKINSLTANSVKTKISGSEEDLSVTDIHIQPSQETGCIKIYDDEDNLLASDTIEEWKEYEEEDFNAGVAKVLKEEIEALKKDGLIDSLKILKPYYFVLIDENKETIADIYLVDDDTLILNDELLKGLDKELDDFLEQLLKE